jgi:uncharacterized MnhB-related membrane protein
MLSSEGPLMMVVHAALIGAVLYLAMTYLLGQGADVALTRSVFGGLLVGLYMVTFGHGMPGQVNPNLF